MKDSVIRSGDQEITLRLPDDQMQFVHDLAAYAGVTPEATIAVLLALYVRKLDPPSTGDSLPTREGLEVTV